MKPIYAIYGHAYGPYPNILALSYVYVCVFCRFLSSCLMTICTRLILSAYVVWALVCVRVYVCVYIRQATKMKKNYVVEFETGLSCNYTPKHIWNETSFTMLFFPFVFRFVNKSINASSVLLDLSFTARNESRSLKFIYLYYSKWKTSKREQFS